MVKRAKEEQMRMQMWRDEEARRICHCKLSMQAQEATEDGDRHARGPSLVCAWRSESRVLV